MQSLANQVKKGGIPNMKYGIKNKALGSFLIGVTISTFFMISSCATMPKDENVEVIKGKKLKEVAPSFWENTKSVTIYYCPKAREYRYGNPLLVSVGGGGSVDVGSTVVNAIGSGMFPIAIFCNKPVRKRVDSAFQEKTNSYFQSYSWKVNDYFIDALKREMHLPKEVNISSTNLINKPTDSYENIINPSDKHIVIHYIFGIENGNSGWTVKTPLTGMIMISVATDEAMRQYVKNCNTLPLSGYVHHGDKASQLWTSLEQLELWPGLYIGSVGKRTKEFSKGEWLSENGAFMERQFQSLLNDLAKGVGELFFW